MGRGQLEMARAAGDEGRARFEGWWAGEDGAPHPWVWSDVATAAPAGRLAALVQSVHMDRFGMACAWLFFGMTAAQVASHAGGYAGNSALNFACNGVFAALYLAFLLAYAVMPVPPAAGYVAGVLLYFVGYAVFCLLYGLLVYGAPHGPGWYFLGASCFLTGSVSLVAATAPAGRGARRFSPLAPGAALWWGSSCFLAGSSPQEHLRNKFRARLARF